MDAAVAALIGAGIGMTGTLFAPLINARLARREKRRELMRTAYAKGISLLVEFTSTEDAANRRAIAAQMMSVATDIEVMGSNEAAKLFGDFVIAVQKIVDRQTDTPSGFDTSKITEFFRIARRDTGGTRKERRHRL
jgi:hypothetical protein